MESIYLDFNATTPIDPEVVEFMIPILKENFGNPSSIHEFGIKGKKAIEHARIQLALLLNCQPSEIIFTSGGTESNNFAIRGTALANKHRGRHIITSVIEHPSVLEVCKHLEKEGFTISYVVVNRDGRIDPASIRSEIRPDTILITIMHANNETGVIQPISDISKISREFNIPFHTDASQSIGKIRVDLKQLGVDLLSVAGHKLYAPKGIGALYIKDGTQIEKILFGANHEYNMRPGTENVLEISGLGKAAEVALRDLDKNSAQMKTCRDLLFMQLKESMPEVIWNGDRENILPNTLNISFPGLNANTLLSELSQIAASAGAACHSAHDEPSGVLKAMGVDSSLMPGTIRFSTGKTTTETDIRRAAKMITETADRLLSSAAQERREIHSANTPIRLTSFTHGMGCACKINPALLEHILKDFPALHHPDILVDSATSDDAAVYRINEEQAIVQTVDFFTPIVDDPFEFGAIAAVNALSDIYAMGASPLFALNIVAFPSNRLSIEVLRQILKGARSVTDEAGIYILGGHTIEDNEPKYGMVVTGLVHPDKILRNSSAMPGHHLILTKALGTGILSTALKLGLLDKSLQKALYNQMRLLNKRASEMMLKYHVSACTDITGFGLSGHLKEMVESSGKGAEIKLSSLPVLPGVLDFIKQGQIPGGTRNNLKFSEQVVETRGRINESLRILFSDAQTSGGLLIAIDPEESESFLNEFNSTDNYKACIIGKITGNNKGKIVIHQ